MEMDEELVLQEASSISQAAPRVAASTAQARPGPPKPPNPTARALARKLADLNTTNVQEPAKRPPPLPSSSGDAADPDDLGQEQIDALFG